MLTMTNTINTIHRHIKHTCIHTTYTDIHTTHTHTWYTEKNTHIPHTHTDTYTDDVVFPSVCSEYGLLSLVNKEVS